MTFTMAHWAKLIGWSAELLHSVCMSALSVLKGNCFHSAICTPCVLLSHFSRVKSRSRFYLARAVRKLKDVTKKGPFSIIISFAFIWGECRVCFCHPLAAAAALPGLFALWWVGGESIFLMGSVHTHTLSLDARARINIFPLYTQRQIWC
jgi:hypothetical protein